MLPACLRRCSGQLCQRRRGRSGRRWSPWLRDALQPLERPGCAAVCRLGRPGHPQPPSLSLPPLQLGARPHLPAPPHQQALRHLQPEAGVGSRLHNHPRNVPIINGTHVHASLPACGYAGQHVKESEQFKCRHLMPSCMGLGLPQMSCWLLCSCWGLFWS